MRNPVRTIDIVPDLVEQSLLSGSKIVDTGYISINNENEVSIYDSHTTKMVVSDAAVLNVWRCPITKLWMIPLKANIHNLKQDTLVLVRNSSQFFVHRPNFQRVCNHIEVMLNEELPSQQ